MSTDGKQLEELVAFVEREALPSGLNVVCNRKIFDDDGIQIAEFDIEVRGKVGTTDFAWLIECRDRRGAAPGSWIEQLVGRRSNHGFHKVTAVSTSGFAPAATAAASKGGIELRTVSAMTVDEMGPWLAFNCEVWVVKHRLVNFMYFVDDCARGAVDEALLSPSNASNLRSSKQGHLFSVQEFAFLGLLNHPEWQGAMDPELSGKRISIEAPTLEDDLPLIDTRIGLVPIRGVRFTFDLHSEVVRIPLTEGLKYEHHLDGGSISQHASGSAEAYGTEWVAGVHKLTSSDEAHVCLRFTAPALK